MRAKELVNKKVIAMTTMTNFLKKNQRIVALAKEDKLNLVKTNKMMTMMVMMKMMVKNEDWLEDLALGATSNPSQSKQSFAALVTTSIIQ